MKKKCSSWWRCVLKDWKESGKNSAPNIIDYENNGGFELVSPEQYPDINELRTRIDALNNLLKDVTGKQKTFQLNDSKIKGFGIGGSHHLIENKLEESVAFR